MLLIDVPLIARVRACLLLSAITIICLPGLAQAHFSYSDPRIVHVAENGQGGAVIYIRMPAPLALLPDDWQGAEDPRIIPPYALLVDEEVVLDITAVSNADAALHTRLADSIALWTGDRRADLRVTRYVFRTDNTRPSFGTLKSAREAFEAPADEREVALASYFNLTLDLEIVAPGADLSRELRVESTLGAHFRVIDKLGTVVKLHRNGSTETGAALGVLHASFPGVAAPWKTLLAMASTGAAHIYGGLDHLAIIALIAIGASGWRNALKSASAFTIGHMVTLTAGLYGFAPAAAWFAPAVEVAIALTIAVAGALVLVWRSHAIGWLGMLSIGVVHGYGFASSASGALFAGPVEAMELAAFAVGLEACQFAIYALALPTMLVLDGLFFRSSLDWRRTMTAVIALAACASVIWRLSDAADAFGIV